MIDKQLMQRRFSKSATSYDKYANVQKKMAHRLVDYIDAKKWDRLRDLTILEVGCGTGYLTYLLRKKFPEADITAMDIAPGMIEIARKRMGEQNIMFICEDIEEMNIEAQYDLIISNTVFQWFNQMDKTMKKLGMVLKEKGVLCFSTFGSRTFTELHNSYEQVKQRLNLQQIGSPGQSFYSFSTLHQLCSDSLNSDDMPHFHITGYENEEYEYFATVRDFFTSIKKIGANNSNEEGYCQRPSLFKELVKAYETLYRENNRIKVTYHCMYFDIEKA